MGRKEGGGAQGETPAEKASIGPWDDALDLLLKASRGNLHTLTPINCL